MQEKRASEPLSIDQFLSAFLLLVLGKIYFFDLILDSKMFIFYCKTIRDHILSVSATLGTHLRPLREEGDHQQPRHQQPWLLRLGQGRLILF